MSEKVDQFCDNLRDRLDRVESRLDSVKTNVEGLPRQVESAVRAQLEAARAGLRSQKQSVDRTLADLANRDRQKLTETKELVGEWKAKREARKLNARADRAEAYAMDSVDFAAATIVQAEEAILDAVLARLDSDAAQLAAPTVSG